MRRFWELLILLTAMALAGGCGNDARSVLERYDNGDRVFKGANLKNADLRGAYLYRADFSGADFRGAKLGNANLGGCNIKGADLTGADLTNTNLFSAYYNDSTKLPEGIDPTRYAMIKED
jgi:uncharacterized protein YjbI with pentapeptide repeats